MLFFIFAIVSAVAILVLFRYFKKYQIDNVFAIGISYFVSALLALAFSFDSIQVQKIITQHSLIAVILGISFFFGFIILSLSTQKSGISVTSVAANISVIIPVLIAIVFYQEQISIKHILGLLLAIPAIYLFFKTDKKTVFQLSLIIFPIFLFFISGFNNSLMRHAERLGANDNAILFIGLIFTVSFITAIVHAVLKKQKPKITHKNISAGTILGILNFTSTYFFLKSLGVFSSALFFPIYNLSFIILSSFIGVILFRERIKTVNFIGLVMVIAVVVLLSL